MAAASPQHPRPRSAIAATAHDCLFHSPPGPCSPVVRGWQTERQGSGLPAGDCDLLARRSPAARAMLTASMRAIVGEGRKVTVGFDRGGWSPALFADITSYASLARTYQPNVVDEIVSLGKVTIATGIVASRAEGPAAHSASRGQGQTAGNAASQTCDHGRMGLPGGGSGQGDEATGA